MSTRAAARIAWALWGLVIVLAVASFVLGLWNDTDLVVAAGDPEALGARLSGFLWVVFVPAYATTGAVVASRRPENLVGWLCLALSASAVAEDIAWQYAARALEIDPGSLPAGTVAAWFAIVLQHMLTLTFALLLLLFPDGRLPSRRWRFVVFLTIGGATLSTLAHLVSPTLYAGAGTEVPNPTGTPVMESLVRAAADIAFAAFMLVVLTSLSYPFFRWRRAGGIQRQQLKWIAYTGAVTVAAALGGAVSYSLTGYSSYVAVLFMIIGTAGFTVGVPVAIGVAVLKHRLYDIDIVINRTLVYGALTATVLGLYVLVVGGLGALLQTQGNLAVSLLATGIVAVLVQPMRSRLQRGVNRLMYGERDEPYAVLSRLGQRLEATLAPEAVLRTIVETVSQALKLPYAAISLKQDYGGAVTAAEYGSLEGDPITIPLAYQTEPVGQLVLAPRRPGEAFSRSDRRLLDDLARQAGVAAHAVRLTTDLQHSRERLVTAREEERRRLRRDLHDGLGPQLASLTLKHDAARNLLACDPAAVDALLIELKAQTQDAISDIRRLVYDLRPPALDELGLVSAIREQAARYGFPRRADEGERTAGGLAVAVEAPRRLPPLPAAVEVACYRIAQEAVANVARHAKACLCRIRLSVAENEFELEVLDNGVGLSAERRVGVGLASMRERAAELGGSCVIEPGPTGGTRVFARLPLSPSEEQ